MSDIPESDDELLQRHSIVLGKIIAARRRLERMKLGGNMRTRQAQWIGSLNFTLLGIQDELHYRGIPIPTEISL